LNSPPPKADFVESSPVVDSSYGQDIVATTVPSFISIEESGGTKDSVGSDSIMVSLNPKEVEIVNLLRCRPGDDYPTTLDQWKESLLMMTEELTFQRSLSPPPTMTIESSNNNDDDKPDTTECDDGATMTSFLDTESFENFDSFVTDFFQDV
jgi:hypothetical protein